MRDFFKGLWQDESGAAAAEYALILVVVAVGIATAGAGLAVAIEGGFDQACTVLIGTVC